MENLWNDPNYTLQTPFSAIGNNPHKKRTDKDTLKHQINQNNGINDKEGNHDSFIVTLNDN